MKINKILFKSILIKSTLLSVLLITSSYIFFSFFKKNPTEIITCDGIIISKTIKIVEKYATPKDLVIFDIDLTLLKENLKINNKDNPVNASFYRLISDHITDYYFNQNIDQIINSINSKKPTFNNNDFIIKEFKEYLRPIVNEKMVHLWNILETKLSYIPMEPNISEFINFLHEKNNKTIAFTAREWKVRNFTTKSLMDVGIDFSNQAIYNKTAQQSPVKNQYGYGYENGILYLIRGKDFTKATQKGSILINFFKAINFFPEKIIFIDNRLDNVQDVVSSLKVSNIPAIGIWYKFEGFEENPK